MTEPAAEKAFDRFSRTASPEERHQALSELLTLKVVPKQADDPRFEAGFSQWAATACDSSGNRADRLLAVAELMRIGQIVRKLNPRIAGVLNTVFASPLAPVSHLKDADDRLNLARACSLMTADWLPTYLAQGIAEEEQGEKARAEMINALVGRVDSLADGLALLADAFAGVEIGTEAPGDSMARRLTRTLASFRPALLKSLVGAGEGVGLRFDALIRKSFRTVGRPQDFKVQIDLTVEVAMTLHDLVRTRFSIATEAETFAALRYCRSFFKELSWPDPVKGATHFLEQDVSEALVLLGRQNVANQGLLDTLELVCGIKERAQVVAEALAKKHTELPESVREWLKRGRFVQRAAASETLQEAILGAIEAPIGLALISARSLVAQSDVPARIDSTLDIYDASLALAARNYFSDVRQLENAILDIAKRRDIDLLGRVGEEIDFSPKHFDLLAPAASQRVVVRRPAVIRSGPDGTSTEVILKGLAE